jgi:hypothetical protein
MGSRDLEKGTKAVEEIVKEDPGCKGLIEVV